MCFLPVSSQEIEKAISETRNRDYKFDREPDKYSASYEIRLRMMDDFIKARTDKDSMIAWTNSGQGYIMTHYIGLPELTNVGECWSEEVFSQLNEEI